MITDPVLLRIGAAAQLRHQGDTDAAIAAFTELWHEISEGDADPLHLCTLAHSMADAQDDVEQELAWDLRALAAAERLTDERMAASGVELSVAGLYPSLHLNLCECYRKLGDLERAREHLRQAEESVGALGDDAYGQLIRDGLAKVASQLP
ncbi:tetratricopeptide repeat protein [Kineosporia babensis]|uniref:Tetratricopeptide repeat protein n=1 Tax=Kineosporia babensis TaxID=499548 RepID=A0A9X1NLS0_9ACTN|nr:tetratricopeptide repeat protein [Kineosporia babensis]MCD5316430.1 tetratricopeptide repeat protein [Kineosporia babensis]